MNIKTITSTEGVNEVDFGSSASRFYWFRNVGTTAVHVSGKADIVAGADGVAELAAGDSVCIETLGGKVYVLGAGKVQIHNTGDKFCPFKNAPAQSGGGTVDAYTKSESDARYPLITDVVPYKMGMDFGTCTTAAETVIKSVTTLHKVAPALGAVFAVKFNNAVPAQARLNINGLTGYIQYRGGSIPNGVINAGDIATFIYYSSSGFNTFEILSVENGGNAATVGGVGIANLRQITQTVINTLPAVPNGEGDFLVNCDTSDTSFPYWYGHLSIRYGSYTGEYVAIYRTTGNDDKVYYNTYLTNHWSGWQEISATPIKSTQISGTTSTTGNVQLWAADDKRIPIAAVITDRYAYIFRSSLGIYCVGIFHPDNHIFPADEAVNGTVYYIEKNTINVG